MSSMADNSTPTKSSTKKSVWWYIRLAVAIVLIILLIPILAKPEFWTTLRSASIPFVIAAFFLSVGSVASKAWRWRIVMQHRGMNLSLGYLLFSYFIGMFFNTFLPSGFGGDAVRAYETARDTGKGAESVTSVIIERGSGMLVIFAVGSLFALTYPALPIGLALLVHALFIGTLIGIWALWLDVTERILTMIGSRLPVKLAGLWAKITRVYEEFRSYRHEWKLFIGITIASIVTLVLSLASIYCMLLALNSRVPLGEFIPIFAILTAVDIVPISLNGLGFREGAYVFLFGLVYVEAPIALGVAVIIRLAVTIQAGFGGAAYLWRSIRTRSVNTVTHNVVTQTATGNSDAPLR